MYVLTVHGCLGAWRCIFPLLLFDALEYNWLYPNSSHWLLIWWHLASCSLAKGFSSAAHLVLEVADRKRMFLCCGCGCAVSRSYRPHLINNDKRWVTDIVLTHWCHLPRNTHRLTYMACEHLPSRETYSYNADMIYLWLRAWRGLFSSVWLTKPLHSKNGGTNVDKTLNQGVGSCACAYVRARGNEFPWEMAPGVKRQRWEKASGGAGCVDPEMWDGKLCGVIRSASAHIHFKWGLCNCCHQRQPGQNRGSEAQWTPTS